MKLTFGQHQTQKQIQTLAPRMIQSMEILQMPLAELSERIEQELIENPVLEMRDKDPNLPAESPPEQRESKQEDVEQKELIIEEGQHNADDFERLLNLDQDVPTFFDDQTRPSSNRVQDSIDRYSDLMANVPEHAETLQQHLLQQLTEWDLTEPLKKMCERIISTLSSRDGGYLRVAILDLLPADAGPEQIDLAEEALAIVQSLDPPGVAARDLRECLLLQLHPEIPNYHLVHQLIQYHLEDLGENRLPQIQKATGASIQEIQEAWQALKRLDPKPASRFTDEFVETVTPDLYLVQDDAGQYTVKMDEGP
ncbi:MAG TPA: RNA polymerase sigma-54 factor, partial [Pirellulaceae bacterium]|nr:RNA polymerase sigma-54 factor [Pirellulaceae bacterium]